MSGEDWHAVSFFPFQRAVWAAWRDRKIPDKVRDSLLRVALDSDGATGARVRITDDAAEDLRVTADHLGRRLKPYRQIGARCVEQPWLNRTHAPTRPDRETGRGRRALYQLQAPAPFASNGIGPPDGAV